MTRRETTRKETNILALLALTSAGCMDVARGCGAMVTEINVGDWTIGQLHTLTAVDAAWRHREILRATLDHADQLLERLQDAAECHAIESEGREILRWEGGQPVFEAILERDAEVGATTSTTWLATAKQRAPWPSTAAEVRTDHPVIGDDLEARARMGADQYGTRLHCHNGRDALVDAYQEALDLVMYMRQAMMERRVSTWHCALAELVAVAIRDQVAHERGDHREDWERRYTEDN